MALGEFNMFSWKSKEAQKKEQEEYALWAFPHGQKQRDNLETLLKELFPKDNTAMILIAFLTCKELYEGELRSCGSRDEAIVEVISDQKKYRHLIKSKETAMYIALVIADADIDELCEYPTADEIRASAQEIDVTIQNLSKKGRKSKGSRA